MAAVRTRLPDRVAVRRLGAGVLVICLIAIASITVTRWVVDERALNVLPVALVAGTQLERQTGVDRGVSDTVRSSVARIEAIGCGEHRQGSASIVRDGDRTVALTNQHVVAGAASVAFRGADGTEQVSVVGERVRDRDAAGLKADQLDLNDIPALLPGPLPAVGAQVVVAGHPGGEYRAEAGLVIALERRTGYGGTVEMLLIDVEALPGISGGVVVDDGGRAVGLVAARDPQTGYTVAYPIRSVLGPTRPFDASC